MKTLSAKEADRIDRLFDSIGAGTGANIPVCIGSQCIYFVENYRKTGNKRSHFKKGCSVEEGNRREINPNFSPCLSELGPERRGH